MIGAIIGGIVAGWAAGKLINGLIYELLGKSPSSSFLTSGNWIGETITAIIGASLLVWIVRLVKK